MAELPDLTVFARILKKRFQGKTLKQLEVIEARKIDVTKEELSQALEGKEFLDMVREGKTLLLYFSGGQTLQIHLMLRGDFALLAPEREVPRYQVLRFIFDDGTGFALTDRLKMAALSLHPKTSDVPDALELKLDYLLSVLSGKRSPIKNVILDQSVIRGIGNAYADEILWDARIYPFVPSKALPEDVVVRLYNSIGSVLRTAIEEIAEANGDELRGEVRDFMRIHHPDLIRSPTGEMIHTDTLGIKTTYYTFEQEGLFYKKKS